MSTPHWIKNFGEHAGELYVAAELSKRGIPNSLLIYWLASPANIYVYSESVC